MPLVEVTYGAGVSAETCERLRDALPDIVSRAVECADEPYDGHLQPGDVLIRFHPAGPFDRFDIDVLIEVKSKWFPDRVANRQSRADEMLDAVLDSVGSDLQVGLYLTMPIAAWAQTESV